MDCVEPIWRLRADSFRWLNPDPERPQLDLLRPFDAELKMAWTVSTKVN
jgi:putative SOS response-associated peptidase YedK